MTYAQRLRQLAARTALDSIAEEMLAIADSLEQQASAQVQGEPVYQYRHADGSWSDQTRASYDYHVKRGATNVRVLYTTPQPAQATQAEVTDLTIERVFLDHGLLATKRSMRAARAILALRPAQVPMTDAEASDMIRETVRGNALRREGSTSLQIVRATERYYGITAQAKKEGA